MSQEFTHTLDPERIPDGGQTIELVASPAECAALTTRMRLPAITRFSCRFRLRRGFGGIVEAAGTLDARLVQTCVVSLEDFASRLTEAFTLRFVPPGQESFDDDPDAVDEIPYAATIDLGEAAAEQLALAIDPYPRKPGVALPAIEPAAAGDAASRVNPFAALAALKPPQKN